MKNRPAFTMLELMVALAVAAAVSVVAVPKIAGVVVKSKATQCSVNRVVIERAEERYRSDHEGLPSAGLEELKDSRYIDRVPRCSEGGHYIWVSTSDPVRMGCSCHAWTGTAAALEPEPVPAPTPQAPATAWGFSEGSGIYTGTAPYRGELKNGTSWTAGKLGSGLYFDGRNDYVHLNDDSALDLSSAGTLRAWFLSPTGSVNSYGGLIHKGDMSNFKDEAYSLQFYGSNKIRLAVVTDSGQKKYLDAPISVGAGQWYNVAATWDATGMKIYINGQVAASNTLAVTARNTAGGLNIGGQTTGGSSSTYFKGLVDEASVTNTAMTAEQISSYYLETRYAQ